MKYSKLGLVASAGAFGLALTACGDDVTKVYDSDSTLTMVGSMDGVLCDAKKEGAMVFDKSSSTVFLCKDAAWEALNDKEAMDYRCSAVADGSAGYNIVCDGETIAFIKNGKDGVDGKDGLNGKNGIDGKDGKDGKNGSDGEDGADGADGASGATGKGGTSVNVDSLVTVITGKTACQVSDAKMDAEGENYLVTVTCGDAEKELKLPVAGNSENLSTVYNRKVSFRLFDGMAGLEPLDFAPSAKVTVMEVDKSFNPTGKNFLFTVPATSQDFEYVLRDSTKKTDLVSFEGDIEVTNMISSYAIVQVEVPLKKASLNRAKSESAVFTYRAAVNLEGSTPIFVSFFSDMKVDRIRTLMAKGSDFQKATKTANEELLAALHMDADGKLFEEEGLETINESLAWMYGLPSLFLYSSEALYSGTDVYVPQYGVIYNAFKKDFAVNGALNTPVSVNVFDESYNGYFDDFANYFMGGSSVIPLQKGLMQRYDLPSCNAKYTGTLGYKLVSSGDEKNVFPYFLCNAEKEVWTPIFVLENKLPYNIESEVAESIIEDFLGECSGANASSSKTLFGTKKFCIVVGAEGEDENKKPVYEWAGLTQMSSSSVQVFTIDKNVECDGKLPYYNLYNGDFYKCVDNEWKLVEEPEGVGFKTCSKDNLGEVMPEEFGSCVYDRYSFYVNCPYYKCARTGSGNDVEYRWEYITSSSMVEDMAEYKFKGKCTEDNIGDFETITLPQHAGMAELTVHVVCEYVSGNPAWRELDPESETDVLFMELGQCQKDMVDGAIYTVDMSVLMGFDLVAGKNHFTCEEETDNEYNWLYVDDIVALSIDLACVSTLKDKTDPSKKYFCTESGWIDNDTLGWCAKNKADECAAEDDLNDVCENPFKAEVYCNMDDEGNFVWSTEKYVEPASSSSETVLEPESASSSSSETVVEPEPASSSSSETVPEI